MQGPGSGVRAQARGFGFEGVRVRTRVRGFTRGSGSPRAAYVRGTPRWCIMEISLPTIGMKQTPER